MARRRIAAVAVAGMALLLVTMSAAPAGAGGGSQLEPDRPFYRPGDAVHLTANVTKIELDWFGPYTAYLRPLTPPETSAADAGAGPRDLAIGRLVVTRLDPRTVRAEVTFVLPKVPDGDWVVLYCSPGCTHRLGDLTGGWLQVGEPPALPPTTAAPAAVPPTTVPPVPTTRSAETTTSAPTTRVDPATPAAVRTETAPSVETATSEPSELRWWLGGALVVAALAAALAVVARRGRGRRSITVAATPTDDDGDALVVVLEPAATSDDEPIGAGR